MSGAEYGVPPIPPSSDSPLHAGGDGGKRERREEIAEDDPKRKRKEETSEDDPSETITRKEARELFVELFSQHVLPFLLFNLTGTAMKRIYGGPYEYDLSLGNLSREIFEELDPSGTIYRKEASELVVKVCKRRKVPAILLNHIVSFLPNIFGTASELAPRNGTSGKLETRQHTTGMIEHTEREVHEVCSRIRHQMSVAASMPRAARG